MIKQIAFKIFLSIGFVVYGYWSVYVFVWRRDTLFLFSVIRPTDSFSLDGLPTLPMNILFISMFVLKRNTLYLCYVMLCYVMLCYVMLCYVMLCYVMLCYVMTMFVVKYFVIQIIKQGFGSIIFSPLTARLICLTSVPVYSRRWRLGQKRAAWPHFRSGHQRQWAVRPRPQRGGVVVVRACISLATRGYQYHPRGPSD